MAAASDAAADATGDADASDHFDLGTAYREMGLFDKAKDAVGDAAEKVGDAAEGALDKAGDLASAAADKAGDAASNLSAYFP